MATYIPWTPVRNYGCGWTDCPQCGPMIELEIEAEHRRKVESTYPRHTPAEQVAAWLGEAYGTGGERTKAPRPGPPLAMTKEEKKLARSARNEARERVRVKRTLSDADKSHVVELLENTVVRRAYLRTNPDGENTRDEWLSEVWLQLLHPSALCAHRERTMPLGAKVERAVSRGQKAMSGERKRIAREVLAAS